MLELKNGKKIYDEVIFSKLNIVFPSKGLVLISGPSGGGKTTLLSCLGGIESLDEGNLYFNGEIIDDSKKEEFRNKHVFFLFQDYFLLEQESILDNLELVNQKRIKPYSLSELEMMLKEYDIDKSLDFKVSLLSGGQKQRLSLLRGLLLDKEILLCDEVTSALDKENSIKLFTLLKKISESRLVILVSHDVSLALEYCSYHIELTSNTISQKKVEYFKKDDYSSLEQDFVSFNNIERKNYKYLAKLSLIKFKKSFKDSVSSFLLTFLIMLISLFSLSFQGSFEGIVSSLCHSYLDYNVLKVSEEVAKEIEGTSLSFTESKRPNNGLINSIIDDEDQVYYSLDGILKNGKIKNDQNKEILFEPLFFEGTLLDVYCNQKAYEIINSPYVDFSLAYQIVTYDSKNNRSIDNVIINLTLEIVEVKDEFSFLLTPIVYYNYHQFLNYFNAYNLIQASSLLNRRVTLLSKIMNASNDDSLTNYEMIIYSKKPSRIYDAFKDDESIVIKSKALDMEESLKTIFSSLSDLIDIFLIVLIIIVLILLSFQVLYIFQKRKKDVLVMMVNSYSRDEVNLVLIFISFLLLFSSLILSLIAHIGIIYLVNWLINKIDPSIYFLNVFELYGLAFPLLLISFLFLLSLLISFSALRSLKNLSLMKEIKES